MTMPEALVAATAQRGGVAGPGRHAWIAGDSANRPTFGAGRAQLKHLIYQFGEAASVISHVVKAGHIVHSQQERAGAAETSHRF